MTTDHPVNRRWNRKQRDWAVVLWIAFLSAAVGAFILFGLVDPLDMVAGWADEFDIGVRLAYGLAFVFLYLVCLLSAALTMFMVRTGPSEGHAKGQGKHALPEVQDPSDSNPDIDGEDWK
jgi:hypothetical protein